MKRIKKQNVTYVFIDASNLFYGGEKSLGWKIDYRKLLAYLKSKYRAHKVFYYGGVEMHGFSYSVLDGRPINLDALLRYLEKKGIKEDYIQRVKFYRKLASFEYVLKLKPVKMYRETDGSIKKKANCDVDMTFDLMRLIDEYSDAVVLSGDGDFAVVLRYLKDFGKKVTVLARGERTAREIRQIAGGNFRDFHYLRELLRFREVKKKRRLI